MVSIIFTLVMIFVGPQGEVYMTPLGTAPLAECLLAQADLEKEIPQRHFSCVVLKEA